MTGGGYGGVFRNRDNFLSRFSTAYRRLKKVLSGGMKVAVVPSPSRNFCACMM